MLPQTPQISKSEVPEAFFLYRKNFTIYILSHMVSVKYLVSFNESSILLYLEKLLKEESSWIRKLTSSVLKTGSASFWKPITAVFPKQNGADKITSAARHSFTGRERSVSWKHRKHYPLLSFLPYLQDKRQPYHLISLI